MGSLRQITKLSENGVRIFCSQLKNLENNSILLRVSGIRTSNGLRNAGTKADVDENIKKFKEENFEKIPDPEQLDHFRISQENTEHRSTGGVNEEPSPNGHAHTAPPNMV